MAKQPQHFEPFYYETEHGDHHVDYMHFGLAEDRADELVLMAETQNKKIGLVLGQHLKKTSRELVEMSNKLRTADRKDRMKQMLEMTAKVLELKQDLPCPTELLLEPMKFGEIKTVPEALYYMHHATKDYAEVEAELHEKVEEIFDTIKGKFGEAGIDVDRDPFDNNKQLKKELLRNRGIEPELADALEKEGIKTVGDFMVADEQILKDVAKRVLHLPDNAEFIIIREETSDGLIIQFEAKVRRKRGLFR